MGVDPPTDQSQPRERDPADDDASPRIPGHRGALPRAAIIDRWITDAMIVERRRATPTRLPPRRLGARLDVPWQDPSDGQSEPPSARLSRRRRRPAARRRHGRPASLGRSPERPRQTGARARPPALVSLAPDP